MGKLKLQVQISIDGFISDRDEKTNWLVWNWGPEWIWDKSLQDYFRLLINSIDTVLLSRKMAKEGFIDHWARVAELSENSQSAFAKHITKAKKIVFSKTLKVSEWENTVIASGELGDEIRTLCAKEANDMIVFGGASFVSSLIKEDLIDEYHLFVNPAALGKGKPIFADLATTVKFKLISAQSYPSGVAVIIYARQKN